MNNQYKKGVLELCVLSRLYNADSYGYDVSEMIARQIDISDGAIYPILRKLKTDGLLTTYLSEESGGPPRKYYSITELGRSEYLSSRNEWLEFVKMIDEILKEDPHEQK